MKRWFLCLCIAFSYLSVNGSYASCTKDEVMKLLEKGFDKEQIAKICGSSDSPSGKKTAKIRVKFVDHIIAYDGILEVDGDQATFNAKLYDLATNRLIKEETRPMELVNLPQGKGFHTRFFIPADSVTPKPHYHEVNLIFEKDENGSITLQNCNQDKCYPGKVLTLADRDSQPPSDKSDQPTLSGAFQLEYTAGTVVHQALRIMTGTVGKIRVKYFNPDTEKPELVEMEMHFKRTLKGDIIAGSNPIDATTGEKHPTYAADNFTLKMYPDGEFKVFNIDDNQVTTEVELTPIKTKREFKAALQKFQWRLATIPEFEEPLR
jgi:hypothetical protein